MHNILIQLDVSVMMSRSYIYIYKEEAEEKGKIEEEEKGREILHSNRKVKKITRTNCTPLS